MIEWNGDAFAADLAKQLGDNLEKAAIFYKGKVKEAINRSQDKEGTGLNTRGLDPSQPGEPPKKLTGFLQRSIAHAMSSDRQQAFVGSNLDYSLYLEIGTVKMAARPFLRRTLAENKDTIAKIIASGKA